MTKELCCLVNVYPEFCIFRGLYNSKVLGIGKEHEGLYWLQESETVRAGVAVKSNLDSTL